MSCIATPLYSRISIAKDKVVRIYGPMKITVDEGVVRILGVNYDKGKTIVINRYRSYALKALEDSVLSIVIGEGGGIEEPIEGEEVIDQWEKLAHSIVEKRGRVVIVGGVESGKTTLTLLLSNIALDKGLRVAIVDGDIGQNDLAPPGFVALKSVDRKSIWLREFRGDEMRFIGYLTPASPIAMARVISAIIDLIEEAEKKGHDIVVVNTDGWFGDLSSIEYKATLVKCIKPNSIAVLNEEFCKSFEKQFKNNVYCFPRPKVVRERSRSDRRELRKINYKTYFENAKRVCINMDNIAVIGSCLFNGAKLSDDELSKIASLLGFKPLAASHYSDALIVMVPDNVVIPQEILFKMKMDLNVSEIFIIKPASVKGLLVAVLDSSLREVSVGVVDSIDMVKNEICLYTEYSQSIGGLYIGRIKVDENFEDRGKVSRCPL